MRPPMLQAPSRTPRQAAGSIAVSLLAIAAIVLGCRWLWDSAGAGVIAVLALAVPYSLHALLDAVEEVLGWKFGR